MREVFGAEKQGHTQLNTSVNKIKKVTCKQLFITFKLFVQIRSRSPELSLSDGGLIKTGFNQNDRLITEEIARTVYVIQKGFHKDSLG